LLQFHIIILKCYLLGDIEESETNILNKYVKTNALKSTIIKIAHHGSKTSSSKKLLKAINPKIALIGVGENNNFGHPNNEVIERLEELGCKIYRTDKMGEIKINVNKKGSVYISK